MKVKRPLYSAGVTCVLEGSGRFYNTFTAEAPFGAGPPGPLSCLTPTVNLSLDFNNNI